jgi:hypothetical protein
VAAEQVRVEPDARNPLGNKAGVLPRCHALPRPTAAGEQELARLLARRPYVVVERQTTPTTLALKAATTTIPIVFFVAGALDAAAAIIGVCKMTALRMIRRGDIKGRQVCSGAPWVIKAEDVAAFAARKRSSAPVTPNPAQQSPRRLAREAPVLLPPTRAIGWAQRAAQYPSDAYAPLRRR